MQQPDIPTKRANGKWNDISKAEYADDKTAYTRQQCWIARINNQNLFIQINGGTNRFAQKHILFPKDRDADKAGENVASAIQSLKTKASSKLEHRRHLEDARHTAKYGYVAQGQGLASKNCLLNLKQLDDGGRHIDEATARVCIATAIGQEANLVVGEYRTVPVDFGTNCGIKARFWQQGLKSGTTVSFNSWMNLGFEVKVVNADTIVVNLTHADTNAPNN